MEGAGELVELDGDAGLQEAQRVENAFVSQRIVLGRRDVGRRKPRKVGGPGGGGIGRHVGRMGARPEIRLPTQHGQGPVPQRRVDEGAHRRRLQSVVELGDVQHLEAERRAAEITGQQGRRRGQPASGTGAEQRQAGRIDPELVGRPGEEHQRAVAVVQAGRERVLGSQPVLDRDHHRSRLDRRGGRARMLGLDAADDEPAPVDHQHTGHGLRTALGPVDPHADVGITLPARDQPVLDVERFDAGDVRPHTAHQLGESGPRRHRVRQVDLRQQLEDPRELRVDHGPPFSSPTAYLGCSRAPASIRIVSAFMYELASSSTASVANSGAWPRRWGNSTSRASLALKASEPSPSP